MNNFKKPLIGILSLYDSTNKSLWMFPGYTEGITAAGGIPVILPMISDLKEIEELAYRLDGFLFSGGQDVDPAIYGQPLYTFCNEIYPPRDAMETLLLNAAITLDKPIFGVCRGLQFINAVLGGSLYQDIPEQMNRKSSILHEQLSNYENPIHDVVIESHSQLNDIMGIKKVPVNSMHHQGIDDLSPRLQAAARSEDGLIEAIEIPELTFGLAVQWHPEFLWRKEETNLNLFKAFVNAAKDKNEDTV